MCVVGSTGKSIIPSTHSSSTRFTLEEGWHQEGDDQTDGVEYDALTR